VSLAGEASSWAAVANPNIPSVGILYADLCRNSVLYLSGVENVHPLGICEVVCRLLCAQSNVRLDFRGVFNGDTRFSYFSNFKALATQ
jgi:hypothetical protein